MIRPRATMLVLGCCWFSTFPTATRGFVFRARPRMATAVAIDSSSAVDQVAVKAELDCRGFSLQNGFFFATVSKMVYKPRAEAEGLLKGNTTCAGLGYDHFHWFEADPAQSSRSLLDEMEDTEAMVAANDDMIIAVFRGTKEIGPDWATNLKFLTTPEPIEWGLDTAGLSVHSGFDDGVRTVWDGKNGMHNTIRKLYNEEGKKRKLYVAGHSLGGALATIATAHLIFVDDMEIAGLYTMGSPMVFNGKLAEIFDQHVNHGTRMADKYFRCRNNNDIVTRIPPGYKHVGTEIYFDQFGTIGVSSFWDQLLGRLSSLMKGKVLEDINDHATSEYVRLFRECVEDSRVSLLGKAASIVQDAATKIVDPDKAKAQAEQVEAAKAVAKKEAEQELSTLGGD